MNKCLRCGKVTNYIILSLFENSSKLAFCENCLKVIGPIKKIEKYGNTEYSFMTIWKMKECLGKYWTGKHEKIF
jgi:uncharacterized protein with PIN domain